MGNNLELGWNIPTLNAFSGYEICIEPVVNPAGFTARMVASDQQQTELVDGVNSDLSRRYRWGVITTLEGANKATQYSNLISDVIDLGKFHMDNQFKLQHCFKIFHTGNILGLATYCQVRAI